MHAILHSFAYPLKPLTQASVSIQPIPILHATHNNVLPYPSVSLLESFCAAIPSGCLTPGIPLRRHSIRMSHIRNPSPPPFPRVSHSRNPAAPPFPLGVSFPESFYATIPSGCLTFGILFCRHSIWVSHSRNPSPPPFPRVSHTRNSSPSTFHLLRMSHIRNSIQPTFHIFLHP